MVMEGRFTTYVSGSGIIRLLQVHDLRAPALDPTEVSHQPNPSPPSPLNPHTDRGNYPFMTSRTKFATQPHSCHSTTDTTHMTATRYLGLFHGHCQAEIQRV
jgi:hypothetical protein